MTGPMKVAMISALVLGLYVTSAGPVIALQGRPQLGEWRVAATPTLSIGARQGAGALRFGRVWDAAILPGGGVVVADAGANELRFFDEEGAIVSVGGGEGEGPGEFTGLFGVEVLEGDSVVAWDFSRGVLSVWTIGGRLLLERPARYATTHEGELLPDGSIVVPRYTDVAPPRSGRYRPPAVLVRHRYDEDQTDELGAFPYDEMLAGSRSGAPMPFRSRSVVAAGGDPLRIVVAQDTNVPRVRVYDDEGSLLRRMEVLDTRRPVTREIWENELETLREEYGPYARSEPLERKIRDWGRPDQTPAMEDLVVDTSGRIWVIRSSGSERWAVIHSMDGRALAQVQLPELERILQINANSILGLFRGELGVESIRTYALARDSGPPGER